MEIALFQGAHRSPAAGDAELAAGVRQMGFDRRLGDIQPPGDFVRLEMVCNALEA